MSSPDGVVEAVSATHTMAKPSQPSIRVIAGQGVEGNAHTGKT
ncbi:MAG: MOSC domain-containing protein, partial [Chloroflexi bacterium]|nr:MOSC domain-containing protein [Chloroflexota bacterium]